MRSLRTLILSLLAMAMLLSVVPPSAAAGDPDAPDYACAEAVFDRIYGRLLNRKAPADDTSRADSVQRLLESADGVVPGSVCRSGDELTWMTEGGVACRFSPYLYSLAAGITPPEETPAAAPATKAVAADGRDVCLIAPYYGLDDSFAGVGTGYDAWGGELAHFTGGSYTRFERTEATIDEIADAAERCAVVLIDSHGELDRDSLTSYICLQTGEGITTADYDVDPALGISHAYYGGRGSGGIRFYEVDGTVIANHMDRKAAGGLFWSGTCFGMATKGLCAPLLSRGVGAVYGYSRDVSFGGDKCWMDVFMDRLVHGSTVAEAAAEMKRVWGAWDFTSEICSHNGWSSVYINHSAAEAKSSGDAFPVVVSARDPYPADPDAVQTVRCDWRLPRLELTLRLEVPDGVKCPDVEGYVNYSGRLPTPEGKPRNQDHSYTFVGWCLTSFPEAKKIPVDWFRAGDTFRFGVHNADPLSFGDSSATLYAIYSFSEEGKTWYTAQVPDGEYDPYDPSALFSDMAFGAWYYRSVRDSVAMGLIKGYNDGTFRPNASIRRGEVVTILYRAALSPKTDEKAGFPDVPAGSFYEKALGWAVGKGIVRGYNDGLFHPDEPVSRAQLAALLRRYAGAKAGDPTALAVFPDRDEVPRWAAGDLAWAVENGLIKGSNLGGRDYLQPEGQATRAQFVTILQRYLATTAKEETK